MTEQKQSEHQLQKEVYEQLWQLAKPYYEKGRPMDVAHIEWMMGTVREVCKREPSLDESLLMPLAILHDVGYSRVEEVKTANYYDLDIRRFHMDEGAKIAQQILRSLNKLILMSASRLADSLEE